MMYNVILYLPVQQLSFLVHLWVWVLPLAQVCPYLWTKSVNCPRTKWQTPLAKFCQTYYNQFKNDSLLTTDSIRAQELKTVSKCLASGKSLCLASAQASGEEIADFHIIISHHQRLQIHNIKFPNGWAAPNSGNNTQAPPPSHKRLALVSGFFISTQIYIWPHGFEKSFQV